MTSRGPSRQAWAAGPSGRRCGGESGGPERPTPEVRRVPWPGPPDRVGRASCHFVVTGGLPAPLQSGVAGMAARGQTTGRRGQRAAGSWPVHSE